MDGLEGDTLPFADVASESLEPGDGEMSPYEEPRLLDEAGDSQIPPIGEQGTATEAEVAQILKMREPAEPMSDAEIAELPDAAAA